MSLDFHDLDEPWYVTVAEDEVQALDGWEAKFTEKYPIVGTLMPPTQLDLVCKQIVRCVLAADLATADAQPLPPPLGSATGAGAELRPADALALAFDSGVLLAPHRVGRDARTAALLSVIVSASAAIERAAGVDIPVEDPATAAFSRCDAYDFSGDEAFQSGYKTVMVKIQQRDMLAHGGWDQALALAEAKAFYYSKCVEPIDVESYVCRAQLARDGSPLRVDKGRGGALGAEGEGREVAASTTSAIADAGKVVTSVDALGEESVVLPPKLSFEEVMALVTAGKEVPGCRKVEVEVQEGEEPSQSVSPRPPKPWESNTGAG